MKELIGKKIEKVHLGVSYPKFTKLNTIEFVTEHEGSFIYQAEGDCCSHAYIEHISGLEFLLDATVLEVEDKGWTDITDTEEGKDHECLNQCFWTVKTNKGYFDLELRLSHNGYYGGWLYYDVKNEIFDKKEITEDF